MYAQLAMLLEPLTGRISKTKTKLKKRSNRSRRTWLSAKVIKRESSKPMKYMNN